MSVLDIFIQSIQYEIDKHGQADGFTNVEDYVNNMNKFDFLCKLSDSLNYYYTVGRFYYEAS